MFCAKRCSEKFRNIQRKTLVLESFFNKVAVLKACNFDEKDFNAGVFLWKVLRTPILKNFCEQLVLRFCIVTILFSNASQHYGVISWEFWELYEYEIIATASKVSVFGVILVRIFPHLDARIQKRLSLCIQSECGKMWTRITPNTDTFHAV